MGKAGSRIIPLSLARQMICDFLAISKPIPLAHGERRVDIRPLQAAVAAARPRPNWMPIFFKAYAIVAASRPALRRMFVPRPWARLYEHPENVGMIVISRQIEGDDALLLLPINTPEKCSITAIDNLIKEARFKPLLEIPAFRRQIRIARLPGPIRTVLYKLAMNWAPYQRVRHFGTFGMSVLASMGIANLTTLVPWSTMIHYTPFDDAGSMFLRIAIDHRVLDGLEVAYALREMEEALNGPLLAEVQLMARAKKAA